MCFLENSGYSPWMVVCPCCFLATSHWLSTSEHCVLIAVYIQSCQCCLLVSVSYTPVLCSTATASSGARRWSDPPPGPGRPAASGASPVIYYVRADEQGNFNPAVWRMLRWPVRRSVSHLRRDLATELGVGEANVLGITLCVRAGSSGRLTPLVIGLPSNKQTMDIIVLATDSPAKNLLGFFFFFFFPVISAAAALAVSLLMKGVQFIILIRMHMLT